MPALFLPRSPRTRPGFLPGPQWNAFAQGKHDRKGFAWIAELEMCQATGVELDKVFLDLSLEWERCVKNCRENLGNYINFQKAREPQDCEVDMIVQFEEPVGLGSKVATRSN